MGLPPGMDTQNLRGGARFQPRPQWLEQPVEDLEARALMLNPDLRESLYNARIAQEETKRVLLRMFPGLSFNYSLNKSNDSYLINDHWREAGVQVSFNLLSLLSAPQQWKLAWDGVSLADQKRLATQMAVLAQLHIARLQFGNAMNQYQRADEIAGVDQRIARHVDNQVRAQKQAGLEQVCNRPAPSCRRCAATRLCPTCRPPPRACRPRWDWSPRSTVRTPCRCPN